jgi:hypothetical protein
MSGFDSSKIYKNKAVRKKHRGAPEYCIDKSYNRLKRSQRLDVE